MKLQIAFDTPDLDKALSAVPTLSKYADIVEVGSMLIYKYGEETIKQFRHVLPNKTIVSDAKIVDRGKESTTLFINAGADWVSVMAGTSKAVIHAACSTAHEMGKKIILDLLDASSPGQAALEAKSFGADAIVFHLAPSDQEKLLFLDQWEMVHGNTTLPIFMGGVTRAMIPDILGLKPDGIIISLSHDALQNWEEEVLFFYEQIAKKL